MDDVVSCSTAQSGDAARFDEAYHRVCGELGIGLVSREDKEKCFGPSTQGVVLGIFYDSVAWVWWLGEEKFAIIMNMLYKVIKRENVDVNHFK